MQELLLPQKFAEVATEGALKNREQNLQESKRKQEKLHQQALEKAKKSKKIASLELAAKQAKAVKLFGTITTKKLAEELAAKGIEVDRKKHHRQRAYQQSRRIQMAIKLTSKVKLSLLLLLQLQKFLRRIAEEEAAQKQKSKTIKQGVFNLVYLKSWGLWLKI